MPWTPIDITTFNLSKNLQSSNGENAVAFNYNNGLGISLGSIDSSFPFQTVYSPEKQARENLKTLLLTRKGERYHLPTFGTDLIKLIFEPNTNEIKEEIETAIIAPISYWLPYINIENITILTPQDDPQLTYDLKISLTYSLKIRTTDTIVIFTNGNTLQVQ